MCLDDLHLNQTFEVAMPEGKVDVLRYRMRMDGPVKVLQLLQAFGPDREASASLFDDDRQMRQKLHLSLGEIGISLINKSPRELLYLSASRVFVEVVQSTVRTLVHVRCQQLQVDNQLPGATFPVMIHPSWSDEETSQTSLPPPSFELRLQRNSAVVGIPFFEMVRFCLSP